MDVSPRLLPPDRREVHVHPGFDQTGGDHPAGQAVLSGWRTWSSTARRWTGNMSVDRWKRCSRRPVDAGRRSLRLLTMHSAWGWRGQLLRQRAPGSAARAGKGHAAEVLVEIGGAGAELHRMGRAGANARNCASRAGWWRYTATAVERK
ncbi:MAG: hypothetical protein ACLU9S_10095 [Oscillospiraceae bacterium]